MMQSPLFQGLGLPSGLNALTESEDPLPMPPSKSGQKRVVLPGFENMPLYKPEDTSILKINDARKINPATGQPFKNAGAMTAKVNPKYVSMVIKHAVNKGMDPNTALAIALQETKIGNLNENMGSAWSTFPDEGIDDPYEQGANSLVKALADKLSYAKRLGYDKKGEAYALQAYNGYGKLVPQNTAPGAVQSFYEVPVSRSKPLNMAENPVYGKTIMSLRDEVVKGNPELQALIKKELASRKNEPLQAPVLAARK
jgi:hypothetical protein